jgi:2-polyprenyl-3-methyl-5-hydroxy-6-metoxy-1,4-benzoquinol methylase
MTKDKHTKEEFFRPRHGLEIEPYLADEDLLGIHHWGRYHWVKTVLRDLSAKKVLDIACGAGYGAFILADFLPEAQITGVDYDVGAVELAWTKYKRENLRFIPGDLVSWTTHEGAGKTVLGSYDAVVSFDTIEHIAHRDIALLRIAENLGSNGVLALSTPCGHSETILHPTWEAHHIEYNAADLKNLLRRFFGRVLTIEDNTLPNREYWDHVINNGKARYLNLANPVLCTCPITP